MQYSFFDFLSLVGALGLFLYGMKIMSEALQKVAGDKFRAILSAMTSNRFLGILTGFLVTAMVQSSSATTVMVVSFVNAGLVTLKESIGVIMGANIGTTVTGWIITLFGFKVQVSAYSLPLIGLGLPFIFSKSATRRSYGELFIGFALIFLGLEYLKDSVPNIQENPEILSFLHQYTDSGIFTTLLFLVLGMLITIVVQSSSATMALTFVMCNQGWIEFSQAAAMILGENIGTTITANIASSVGNISAKRAARVHFIFNALGVIWMLAVFDAYTGLIDTLITKNGGVSPNESPAAIPTALSIFHTSFNVFNVLIFVWFAPFIQRIVEYMLPYSNKEGDEEFRLKYITTGMLSTSELSVLQAKKEVQFYAKHTTKMFGFVRMMINEDSDKKFNKLFSKVQKYEGISDNVEVEITNYLTQVSQYKLSELGRKRIRSMLKLAGDLESIADSNFNLARSVKRMREKNIQFSTQAMDKLELMFNLVEEALSIMRQNLQQDELMVSLTKARLLEDQINNYRNQLKREHLDNLAGKVYSYEAGIIFNDLFSESEKLADYVINVSEALEEVGL